MTAKYEVIGSQTLTSSAASVTFSSIPGGYKDLVLIVETKGLALIDIRMRFNSDTGANYSYVFAYGNGSSAASGSFAGDTKMSLDFISYATGTNAHISQTEIMDYSATNKHKSVLSRGNSGAGTDMAAQRWASTAAVTSVNVFPSSSSFATGSTFHLLGVN